MHFIIDKKLKIIFGWSAKCGCSHIIKIIYFLMTDNIDSEIHTPKDCNNYITNIDIENYTTILIIRNPYERLISGFLNKYRINGEFRHMWKHKDITFSNFVNELIHKNWNIVDCHHFTPQTTELFDANKIARSKTLKIYDIKNIDYNYIQSLYNKVIPDTLIQFRGGHERKINTNTFEGPVYNLNMSAYFDYNVSNQQFYNTELKDKVYNFYINDFNYFKQNGFNYDL